MALEAIKVDFIDEQDERAWRALLPRLLAGISRQVQKQVIKNAMVSDFCVPYGRKLVYCKLQIDQRDL